MIYKKDDEYLFGREGAIFRNICEKTHGGYIVVTVTKFAVGMMIECETWAGDSR